MEPGYDGEIKIDSSIDTKGFNKDIKKLSKGMKGAAKGVASMVGKIAIAATAAVGIIIAIAVALVVVAIKVGKLIAGFVDELYKSLSATSAFRDKVVELKTAFDNVKGAIWALGATLLNALMPIIMKVINWLIKAINDIAMLIASWAGQKTVLQYVAGSMSDTADSAGRIEDAAKGALAAFDEINVLDLTEPDEPMGGGGGVSGGAVQLVEVDVPVEHAKNVWENFKEWLKKLWEGFWDRVVKFAEKWGPKLGEIFVGIGEWIKKTWENVGAFITKWATIAGDWIAERITKALDWIEKRAAMFKEYWGGVFNSIANWAREKAAMFKEYWGNAFENIKFIFSNAWNNIKAIWGNVTTWFWTNVLTPIIEGFNTALNWLGLKWEEIFTGIETWVKGSINNIIGFINGMIAGIVSGLNVLIGLMNSLPSVTLPSGRVIGFNLSEMVAPEIPTLATGAVIPPNSAFAAILGDQTSGKNIEAPEGLIRQIIQEEMGTQEHTFKFTGTMGALVRAMKPEIDKENTRIGTSLVQRSSS